MKQDSTVAAFMKSPRKATTAIENASDKQDPATCIGTGSCFERRTKTLSVPSKRARSSSLTN